MTSTEELVGYLQTCSDLTGFPNDLKAAEELGKMLHDPGIDRLRSIRNLVLQFGREYVVGPQSDKYPLGDSGRCHQESILLSRKHGLTYVEGFALAPHAELAYLHGWCIKEDGQVVEATWRKPGLAYYGVPFNPEFVERQFAAFETWTGQAPVTGSMFNNPVDNYALLAGLAPHEWILES